MKKWMTTPQEVACSNGFGELFDAQLPKRNGGDATCPEITLTQTIIPGSNAASKVQSSDAADITANRHGGNPESESAFRSIKDRLTEQQERVLRVIRYRNELGVTVDEIAEILGTTPNTVSGRATELKRDGKIYKSGTRLTRSGNSAAILKAI